MSRLGRSGVTKATSTVSEMKANFGMFSDAVIMLVGALDDV